MGCKIVWGDVVMVLSIDDLLLEKILIEIFKELGIRNVYIVVFWWCIFWFKGFDIFLIFNIKFGSVDYK